MNNQCNQHTMKLNNIVRNRRSNMFIAFVVAVICCTFPTVVDSFTALPIVQTQQFSATAATFRPVASSLFAVTAEPVTKEDATKIDDASLEDVEGFGTYDTNDNEYEEMEYAIDQNASRDMEKPFHILLMERTFTNPKVTLEYCAQSLSFVLGMPSNEATEMSQASKEIGMACLGTWKRDECLIYGRQLQMRDLVVRIVPYTRGGQRSWQAKDTTSAGSSSSSSSGDSSFA